jgi:replicative DNA helicase
MTTNPAPKSSDFTLPVTNVKSAVVQAKEEIAQGLRGEQLYLRTRWSNVNNMLMGGFRFDSFYFLSGASGTGKSFLMNMLHQDFTNQALNSEFKEPFRILHFNFEMSASDEILRKLSASVSASYRELLSIDRPLSQEQCDKAYQTLDSMEIDKLFYVEKAGNRYEMYNTIKMFHTRFPGERLVVTLDHTLLVKYYDEKSEVELLSELGKMFIELRKEYGLCIIALGQLNDKIEDPRRRTPQMHYPTKTDIHGSKQLYHAADVVLILHKPEDLHITEYGPLRYPTAHALFLHQLKARKGEIGLVRLREDFAHGNIHEWATAEPSYSNETN